MGTLSHSAECHSLGTRLGKNKGLRLRNSLGYSGLQDDAARVARNFLGATEALWMFARSMTQDSPATSATSFVGLSHHEQGESIHLTRTRDFIAELHGEPIYH